MGDNQQLNADDQKEKTPTPKKANTRKAVASNKKASSSVKTKAKVNPTTGSTKSNLDKEPKSDGGAAASKVKESKAKLSSRPIIFDAYATHVIPTMMKEYNYRSVMEVPKLDKIALNVSVGDAKEDNKAIDSVVKDITIISGQKPVVTRARKAIAGFKIRQGMPIGVSVTLRGNRMGYFFERLLNASLPRIRDFRGLSRSSFDGRGNYSIGIKEQVTFPEIDYNQVDRIRGLQVTICTTAKTDAEGARFLELLGMPFVREG
ncbi:50S ribosomal protein L5 [SAR202 cluster bacterium AC-409-J13_OGT_754m]|nr:50S ribosomal protein L5 [SAR202 cluster bacterium AC-409-J13_OGT_754m]